MYLKEILEDVLPTKWSRRIMGLSFASSIAVFPLPYLLPPSTLKLKDTEILLIQFLLSLSTLLIGTLACLILVVIAYHKQRKELSDEIFKLKNPPPSFTEINVNTAFLDEINKKDREKFTRHNGLLWLAGDSQPYCQTCLEVRDTEVHMILLSHPESHLPHWFCPKCGIYIQQETNPIQ